MYHSDNQVRIYQRYQDVLMGDVQVEYLHTDLCLYAINLGCIGVLDKWKNNLSIIISQHENEMELYGETNLLSIGDFFRRLSASV